MLYCTYPFGENTIENLLFYKKEITLQVDPHSNIKAELHLIINPLEKEGIDIKETLESSKSLTINCNTIDIILED